MSLKIGPKEAQKIRKRMEEIGLTQKSIADQLGLSERHLRGLLSTKKDNSIRLHKDKVEDLMAILGVGLQSIFDERLASSNNKYNSFVNYLKHKTYAFLIKENPEIENQQELAGFLKEDPVINKTMGFGSLLIAKTISDRYPIVRNFLTKNDFFNIIPETGFWQKIVHDASIKKNTYFSFKISTTVDQNIFNIAYTIASPISFLKYAPNKIKITYGRIEQQGGFTYMNRYNDTPAAYRIPYTKDILVTIWLDEADHDFIITCANEFTISYEGADLGYRSLKQVKESFHKLETIVFPRHHLFHRNSKTDLSDDPWLFWSNDLFIEVNKDLFKHLDDI